MKKILFACLILLFIFCGCQEAYDPTVSQTAGDSAVLDCSHPESELGGLPKYVYGKYCDDPVEIYLTCNLCGEEVFRGTMENDFQCTVGYGNETVVKEPTCTEVGKAEGNCSICGRLKQWELPMIEHEYLWFYGDDAPCCKSCGLVAEVCSHEFEQTNDVSFSKSQAGFRGYQCKHCEEDYSVYYDEHGDYDVQSVVDAISMEAQKYGWTVILDYNLLVGDELNKVYKSFQYRDMDSTQATTVLTNAGMELLDVLNQDYYSPDNDRSDYYLTVVTDITRSASFGTTFFNINLYVRLAD